MFDDLLTESQRKLHNYMSDLSELAYCAGWMDGTEYRLWAFMLDVNDDGHWGAVTLTQEVRSELLSLNSEVCGWICWAEAANNDGNAGPIFAADANWRKAYARRAPA